MVLSTNHVLHDKPVGEWPSRPSPPPVCAQRAPPSFPRLALPGNHAPHAEVKPAEPKSFGEVGLPIPFHSVYGSGGGSYPGTPLPPAPINVPSVMYMGPRGMAFSGNAATHSDGSPMVLRDIPAGA